MGRPLTTSTIGSLVEIGLSRANDVTRVWAWYFLVLSLYASLHRWNLSLHGGGGGSVPTYFPMLICSFLLAWDTQTWLSFHGSSELTHYLRVNFTLIPVDN